MPTQPAPLTPKKSGQEFERIIDTLNEQFSLALPNPKVLSPGANRDIETPQWQCYRLLQRLYYHRKVVNLNQVLNNFDEWVCSRNASDAVFMWARQDGFPATARSELSLGREMNVHHERDERLGYLMKLVADEVYILTGSYPAVKGIVDVSQRSPKLVSRPLKRRLSTSGGEESSDEFQTAPNSPEKSSGGPELDCSNEAAKTSHVLSGAPAFIERLAGASNKSIRYDAVSTAQDGAKFSFSAFTADTLPYDLDSRTQNLQRSFNSTATFATEVVTEESGSTYDEAAQILSEEATISKNLSSFGSSFEVPRYCAEGEIMADLLQSGPFSLDHLLPASIPLFHRYELERIGRAWDVPLNRMLVGSSMPLNYDSFWGWIEGHGQREGKPIPEKTTRRAWDAACGGTFKTDKHSEVVVLTGDLDWCSKSEPGVLKLKLKPLKTERSCRFHRRYGSDRFLSLTLPAPTRPPKHLRLPSHPALLREGISSWLTQNPHKCLGRTWSPFFLEEVKQKRKIKAEPRFRVDFFAIDGIDFVGRINESSHRISAKNESASNHTPMSLECLLEWHLAPKENISQTNLKLFQRMSLGLSKTFATVVLEPKQVFYLRDDPNHRVMNDGCALMSRQLANQICDNLGIAGNTPSAFQGRIAGAKGLWMVDKHRSQIEGADDDIWIQISDSQLKINPHPRKWEDQKDPVDDEKLTFEVVKWSKPLHPVDLNVQLLAILDHGGHVKDYIADLARLGIQAVARDFEEVFRTNCPVLCRSVAEKIRPTSDSGAGFMAQSLRRLEQWMADDIEAIVRFSEAGFAPRDFYPLRKRLGKCLRGLLERYVEELRIEVPLSTYAFCIADPYGVLGEDEVHFGLSNNWRDDHGQFEDNLLDGIDVLVGRLPAHLPSDIQRRKAVWKPELRHFKDVIVFPTTGETPLADMLSGGDYDGDTPWICWDQNIVRNFYNSQPPSQNESYPPDHFGLTKHSVPMREIQSMGEFLDSSFTFNLTLSNLGRCTVEHEKLSYDESIDSPSAKELSFLLSHLVDGCKAGVHLSEAAWQQYRKKISPRARVLPAYKNTTRKANPNNIIDYIRFVVSHNERIKVLTDLQNTYPEAEHAHTRDPDLVQPWNEAREKAVKDQSVYAALKLITRDIHDLKNKWDRSLQGGDNSFSSLALEAAEQARAIPPPTSGDNPMIHVWQHSQSEWLELLTSYTYKTYPTTSFVLHAFGEYLCQIKSRKLQSRIVSNEILACYRVNQKVIARLKIQNSGVEEDGNGGDEYEGHEAIEAMMYGTAGVGGYYDPDDQMSVE